MGYSLRWESGAYRSWVAMRQRCRNPNHSKYPQYGGRGITVCERWDSFENFLADMGERPEGMSINRIDNDGNYEPGNCEWATSKTQANNQRMRKRKFWCIAASDVADILSTLQRIEQKLDDISKSNVAADQEYLTVAEAAKLFKLSKASLYQLKQLHCRRGRSVRFRRRDLELHLRASRAA